jgi:hypothetical protein
VVEEDTQKMKIGDGSTAYNDLSYLVSDATITLSDVTTGNASTGRHGFLRKLSNIATQWLNGAGNWTTPTASDVGADPAGSAATALASAQAYTDSEVPDTTDDLSEGSTNKYFTDERVDDRVAALIQSSTTIEWSYDDALGTLSAAIKKLLLGRYRTFWFEEFMTGGVETGEIGMMNWEAVSANGGSTTAQAATAGRPGQYRVTCGNTLAAGRSTLYLGQSVVQLGGGAIEIECGINIGQVPDGTNTFSIEAGLGDTPSGTTTDGVYFLFDRAVSTTNWQGRSVSNSVGTNSDTGVAIASGWVAFKIIIDDTAAEVKYYINDALVATITTNIPSGSGRSCAPQFKVIGSAGTGANRYIDADYYGFDQIFSSAR